MGVSTREFGTTKDGKKVTLYHIENSKGAYAEVIDFGAILVKLAVQDKEGNLRDVVLGYDDIAGYEVNGCFFGATIGRNGNRIANAKFTINDKEYELAQNENENNLHSGPNGFEKKLWNAEISAEQAVTFSRISPDGENGFPGEFNVSVTYELTDDNEIKIMYNGKSTEDTVANLTNHSYFNLGGEGSGSILDHELMICAKKYTPVKDGKAIPTGENASVEGTVFDFTSFKKIGKDIEADVDQLKYTGGFDHNFVTDEGYEKGLRRKIAAAYCAESGIEMEVFTDCPCVQFYAGNFVISENGKNDHLYTKRTGFCLETQVEPNAVNEKNFYSPVLKAGDTYHSQTSYRFSVR
ncbi:MAG: aldose epimerase family protein [Eubacteriales bacterium]|nr:aldose epimerase family protein [Eubacteriales bacterium]